MHQIPDIPFTEQVFLSASELKKLDQRMVNEYEISVLQMMECAGLNTALLAKYLLDNKILNQRISIVCGKGHNGGDGFVAARHLSNWGADVKVIALKTDQLTDEPLFHFNTLKKLPIPIISFNEKQKIDFTNTNLIIDALLGFGLTGAPREHYKVLITKINTLKIPILALDTPSGLNVSTGEIYDPCIKAAATLSLACLKTGFQNKQAKKVLGKLFLADIGIPPELYNKQNPGNPPSFSISTILKVKA